MNTTEQLECFRQRLARSIEQRGYSYRNFSLSLGKSSNYISSILSGESNPSIDMLLEMCDVLSVSVGDLFGDSDDSVELMELMPKLRNLSSAELAFFNRFVDLVKEETERQK